MQPSCKPHERACHPVKYLGYEQFTDTLLQVGWCLRLTQHVVLEPFEHSLLLSVGHLRDRSQGGSPWTTGPRQDSLPRGHGKVAASETTVCPASKFMKPAWNLQVQSMRADSSILHVCEVHVGRQAENKVCDMWTM